VEEEEIGRVSSFGLGRNCLHCLEASRTRVGRVECQRGGEGGDLETIDRRMIVVQDPAYVSHEIMLSHACSEYSISTYMPRSQAYPSARHHRRRHDHRLVYGPVG
jgi:hypothetical protein